MKLLRPSLVLLAVAASLASRSSSAQTAPVPASVAPATTPAAAPADGREVPSQATQRKSDGMMFGGLGLIGTGLGVAISGGVLLFSSVGNASVSCTGGCGPHQDHGPQIVSGFVMMIGGGLGVLIGVPLTAVGGHRVPATPRDEAKLVVGPGRFSLQVPF